MDYAKAVVIGLIIIVLFCLFRALYFMVTSKGESGAGVANFLTLRVTFSAVLIAFLVFSNYMGWLKFHGPYQDPRLVHQMQQQQELKKQQESTE